jgi:hypothetical protein
LVNDLGREAIPAVADFLHPLGYSVTGWTASPTRRDNATDRDLQDARDQCAAHQGRRRHVAELHDRSRRAEGGGDGARFDPLDEEFRYVYSDDTIDFDHFDRFDFARMGKAVVRWINARVKADVLVDVGVKEFSYATHTAGRDV